MLERVRPVAAQASPVCPSLIMQTHISGTSSSTSFPPFPPQQRECRVQLSLMSSVQQRHTAQRTPSPICCRAAIQLSHQVPAQPLVNRMRAKVCSIHVGDGGGHIINTNSVRRGCRFKCGVFLCD